MVTRSLLPPSLMLRLCIPLWLFRQLPRRSSRALPSPRPHPSPRLLLSPRLPPSPRPCLSPSPATPVLAQALSLLATVPLSRALPPSTVVTSRAETACSQPTPSPLAFSELPSLARSGTTALAAVPVSRSPVHPELSRPW